MDDRESKGDHTLAVPHGSALVKYFQLLLRWERQALAAEAARAADGEAASTPVCESTASVRDPIPGGRVATSTSRSGDTEPQTGSR